jgi:hypothetical protein
LSGKATNLQQTLTYNTEKLHKELLVIGLVLTLVSLFAVHDDGERQALAWLILSIGLGLSGYAFFKIFNPGKPVLELSPKGIVYRLWGPDVLIPWSEVKAVNMIDIKSTVRGVPVTFTDITTILVSKHFYDASIEGNTALLRANAWQRYFTPKGEMMQIAFPHTIMPVKPQELHQAIEARWRAFSEAGRAAPAQTILQPRRDRPSVTLFGRVSPFHVALLALAAGVAIFFFSNVLPRWQTPAQIEAREQPHQDANKRIDEQWKQFDQRMNQ